MKKKTNFKIAFIEITLLAVALWGVYSCNNSEESKNATKAAEKENEARFDNNKQEKDAQFLVDAAEINLKEIRLGELAQSKSVTPNVKELANMMVSSHNKSLGDLVRLAREKSITIPTTVSESGQEAFDKLSKKSGIHFDKEYCDMMVKGHKEAIAKFEKASDESSDPDIKDWAVKTLPELRMHLDHAMASQNRTEKIN
jgi:putative membrane protein